MVCSHFHLFQFCLLTVVERPVDVLTPTKGGSKISTGLQAGLVWGKVLQVDGPLNVIVGGGAAIPVSRLLPSLSIVDAGSPLPVLLPDPHPNHFATKISV